MVSGLDNLTGFLRKKRDVVRQFCLPLLRTNQQIQFLMIDISGRPIVGAAR